MTGDNPYRSALPVVRHAERHVVCGDCRYISTFAWMGFAWDASCCFDPAVGRVAPSAKCVERNRDNACRHYRRKWWKFWAMK